MNAFADITVHLIVLDTGHITHVGSAVATRKVFGREPLHDRIVCLKVVQTHEFGDSGLAASRGDKVIIGCVHLLLTRNRLTVEQVLLPVLVDGEEQLIVVCHSVEPTGPGRTHWTRYM
jgi:hypothetical protein